MPPAEATDREPTADLDALGTDELFALSDRAFREGRHDVSRAALMQAVERGEKLHIAYHKLARLDFASGRLQDCVRHLRLGLAADGSFPFNWLWLAKAHHMLGDPDAAAEHAERFAAFGVAPYNAAETALLEALAAHLAARGQHARSLALHEYLVRIDPATPRLRVRLAEALAASGQAQRALEILEPMHAAGALDVQGRRTLAETRALAGDRSGALSAMDALFAETDGDPSLLDPYARLLRQAEPAALRASLAANGGRLPCALRQECSLRLDVAAGRIEEAVAALLADEAPIPKHLRRLGFETAYQALAQGRHDIAMRLGDRLLEGAPDELHAKLLRVNTLFADQAWEQAGEVLASLGADSARSPHALLKRFEHACFMRDMEQAERLLRELEAVPAPSKDFQLPIFRYLAERGAWADIMDRAIPWLDSSFRHAAIGGVLFRAAKRTGRQAELIAAIEAIDGWTEHDDLRRLRSALALDAARTPAELARIEADPLLADAPALRPRLAIQREVWARALGSGHRRVLFLCADRAYLCGSLVALHSALPFTAAAETDHILVVSDDLLDRAERLFESYRASGHAVRALPARWVLNGTERLDARYGLFTSGHALSESAYHRIFVARHLLAAGGYERALYIDADVLVRAPLAPLFEADLDGAPLSARLEPMRPEVRRAIRLHGLRNGQFFNSGVLLFDLTSGTVAAGLDRAIGAIADETVTLLWQDQCALNIGFDGDFRPMDSRWNQPVGTAARIRELPPEAAILHFLDRPKPWHADYMGECAMLWFEQWRSMAGRIGERAAIELLEMANA